MPVGVAAPDLIYRARTQRAPPRHGARKSIWLLMALAPQYLQYTNDGGRVCMAGSQHGTHDYTLLAHSQEFAKRDPCSDA